MSAMPRLVAQFDPYYKWLGIPRSEQPADYYRLLGIGRFESDPEVISNAADQRMIHLPTMQTGHHAAVCQRVLNEIAAARVYLLTPEKKRSYDTHLSQQLLSAGGRQPFPLPPSGNSPPPCVPPPVAYTPPVFAMPPASPAPASYAALRRLQRRRKSGYKVAVAGFGCAFLLGVAVFLGLEPQGTFHARVRQLFQAEPERTGHGEKHDLPQARPEQAQPDAARVPTGNPPIPNGAPALEKQLPAPDDGELERTLKAARLSMATRDLARAHAHIESARRLPGLSAERIGEVRRVERLLESLDIFWKAVRTAASRIESLDELLFEGNVVAIVVEVDHQELLLHCQGGNQRYCVEGLPCELAVALAERWLAKGHPVTDLAIGSFLIVDPEGDREKGRRRWERAGEPGREMLPELDRKFALRETAALR